jgi:hypothetical protein
LFARLLAVLLCCFLCCPPPHTPSTEDHLGGGDCYT